MVRAIFFPPTYAVSSIRDSREYQDSALLERGWALPTAQRFRAGFSYQSNGSKCGPSSLANVYRSFGESVDEDAVLKGTGECRTGICFGGLGLDQLAAVARQHAGRSVTVLRDLDYDAFKAELRRSNDPQRRYIVNFNRGLLFARGYGHHSPIGGYFEPENLVFVLDVNREYKPWLVDARRLYDAMNSVDPDTGAKRGLLLIE
jgi:hypothetical protein